MKGSTVAEKNFIFVFVKDKTYSSPTPYLLEYVRFRHSQDSQHKVVSVRDAIAFMLQELQPGDTLNEVHLYSHSNALGYVWGRLRTQDRYQGITITELLQYHKTDKNAKSLATFGNENTIVYVHGCNLGKYPEALRYWRNLFGGQKGRGIAPKLFQHFGLSLLTQEATWGKGKNKEIIYTKEIQHTHDVNDFVTEAVFHIKELRQKKLKPEAEKLLRENTEKALNQWLLQHYQFMVTSGDLPSNMAALSLEQTTTQMRTLFNAHKGIPTPFLFRELRQTEWPTKGNLRETFKPKGAIFPEDPQWKTQHHIEQAQ